MAGKLTEIEQALRDGLDGVTPGPWMVYDGCSWRRIGTAHGRRDDCAVLAPTKASDGHPDLTCSRGNDRDANLEHIARCDPDTIRALLDELSRLRAATKCPIGLDHVKEICSAGSCLTCITGRYEHYYDRAKAYEATLKDIAASDDIENALDPARNKRVAARVLSEREGQE